MIDSTGALHTLTRTKKYNMATIKGSMELLKNSLILFIEDSGQVKILADGHNVTTCFIIHQTKIFEDVN
jgi:hypothetical protein